MFWLVSYSVVIHSMNFDYSCCLKSGQRLASTLFLGFVLLFPALIAFNYSSPTLISLSPFPSKLRHIPLHTVLPTPSRSSSSPASTMSAFPFFVDHSISILSTCPAHRILASFLLKLSAYELPTEAPSSSANLLSGDVLTASFFFFFFQFSS